MKQNISIGALEASHGALDYSHLLDAPAGKHGFVTAEKGHLYFEDGTRARFIGFNLAARSNTPTHEKADRLAERLASLGVNIIRLHAADAPMSDEKWSWASSTKTPLIDYAKGSSREFNPEGLDRFDYLISALEKKGIYLHIDLVVARFFEEGDGLEYPGNAGTCFKCYPLFNERLIELQQEYAQKLLRHVNPYTGKCLVEDPAVVTVQINNEDSAIKGTMDSDWNAEVQPYRDEVRRKWNAYLLSRYGDREHLKKAWTVDGVSNLGDDEDPVQGTVAIVPGSFYQVTNDPDAGKGGGNTVSPCRYADYMEFGIETNRRFYRRMKNFLKSLGVRVPIAAGNLMAGAADVYGHLDGDLMENNSYFNHPILPCKDNDYNVAGPVEAVTVNPLTMQRGIGSMATTIPTLAAEAAVDGKPFMITEWNEYGLHPFHSTSFLSTAAYACLNDWDGLILYNYATAEDYDEPGDEIASIFDSYNDPALICEWGTMAEMFLKGLVRPSEKRVDIAYTKNDLMTLHPMHMMPLMYLTYVTGVRNSYDGSDVYEGNAEAACNAGLINSGNLDNAEHGIYYAWTDQTDPLYRRSDHTRLAQAAERSEEISEGIHLGRNLVFDDIRSVSGSGDYTAFADALDQALKKWGLLDQKTGLQSGALISSTDEICFDPHAAQFRINAPKLAVFSGKPDGTIHLGDLAADVRNERITVTAEALNGRTLQDTDEILMTAISDTGMDQTETGQGPSMMGFPLTQVRLRGKLYFNTMEGELAVPAKHAELELLAIDGTVLKTLKEDAGTDGMVRFALDGSIPSAQYRLKRER